VKQNPNLAREKEEERLLTIAAAWRTNELIVADQLADPRHSMLYPEVKKLKETLAGFTLEYKRAKLAVKAHRKKMAESNKPRPERKNTL
jgi:hypothetical protein